METLTGILSEKPRWNGTRACTTGVAHVAVCPAFGIETRKVRGSGAGDMARRRIAGGVAPSVMARVVRDGRDCLCPAPVGRSAGLTVEEGDKSVRLREWKRISGETFRKPSG